MAAANEGQDYRLVVKVSLRSPIGLGVSDAVAALCRLCEHNQVRQHQVFF